MKAWLRALGLVLVGGIVGYIVRAEGDGTPMKMTLCAPETGCFVVGRFRDLHACQASKDHWNELCSPSGDGRFCRKVPPSGSELSCTE